MTKFKMIGIVGAVYVCLTLLLIILAVDNASDIRLMRSGGGSIFTMYGLAILGLSIVAGVTVLALSREHK